MSIRRLFLRRQRAAAGMQYATILGLIAVVALLAISAVGDQLSRLLSNVGNKLCASTTTGDCAAVTADVVTPPPPPPPPPPPTGTPQLSASATVIDQNFTPGECAAVTFTNSGTAAASGFQAPVVTGTYQATGCPASTCTGSLPALSSCTVQIRGTATASGALGGSVSLTATSGGTATATVTGAASLGGGALYSWGRNNYGMVADGSTVDRGLPTIGKGENGTGTMTNITQVTTGLYFSCASNASGNVWCWGYNNLGSLGNNSTSDSIYPVKVTGVGGSGFLTGITAVTGGQYHACGLGGGQAWCWGQNNNGQVGNGFSAPSVLAPKQVVGVGGSGVLTGISTIAAGIYHTCAMVSGSILCWGDNTYGQLGDNSTVNHYTPDLVHGLGNSGTLAGMSGLALGSNYSCAYTGSAAYCWGYNYNGALGNNTTNDALVPVQVVGVGGTGTLSSISSLASGHYFNCAVIGGGVKCWGLNTYGQLGNNTVTSSSYPVTVMGVGAVGSLSGVSQVAPGFDQACALASGSVYCWGNNAYRTLGNNTTTSSSTPVRVIDSTGSGFLSGVTSLQKNAPRAYSVHAIK